MALTTVLENASKVQASTLDAIKTQEYNGRQKEVVVGYQPEEQALLKVLGDEYARTILLSIIDEPKSVIDITREKGIPISSVYRKIHWLENARLITVKGFVITGDGKKYHLYQSRIKTIQLSIAKNEIRVEFTKNNGVTHNSAISNETIPIE